jgi:potassium efflux system protein
MIGRAVACRGFNGLSLCFIAVTLFFALFVPFITEIQAQTAAAHSNTSNGIRQPQQSEIPPVPPNRSEDQAISLPKIADRAEELDRLLREINSQLMPKSELLESERKAAEQTAEIGRRALQTRELLAGNIPTPLELEDEQRYWRSRNLEHGEERRLLTLRAAKLEEQIQTLEAQQPEWLATWIHIRESSGIEAVVERIKQQLDKIQAAKSRAQEQLNAMLTLQNKVSQQDQQISDILLRIRDARDRERNRLLAADNPPLWEARLPRQLDQAVGPAFHGSFDRSFTMAQGFLRAHKLAVLALVGSYLLVLLAVFKLSQYVAHETAPEPLTEPVPVLNRPFSVALLLTLIGTGTFVSSAPVGIAIVFYLLYLIPILRVLAPLIEPRLRIILYVLASLYALEGMYLLVQLPPLVRRELYVLLSLVALISLSWLARPSKLLQATAKRRSQRMLVIAIQGILALLAVSLVCNIIGFVSLSQVLGMTALIGPFLASALYCGARVLSLIVGIVLRTHWARTLFDMRVDAIDQWASRLFALGAILLWLKSVLQLATLYDSLLEGASKLFTSPIGFEKIRFTLGDVLGLGLILLGGYFVANAFTFLLKKLVLPKLPLQRGLPYAISTVTYYVLLLLVGLAALSGAGIELNKFTVLTGAIGVGLGFGLQNIVNNFVSGLILLFERPIHVGDTVDVGGLVGIVRRIGARSSTVVTFQGAEVIVPNSNLLSNQVINWTLSSQWRRVDVPIRVAYGTDPERVIKLLVGVAESYPGVLLERPPMAFFMGFGESSLNFELRFWSAWQDTWFQLQSDVTVAVAKALREAGIEIPFPQRDLHVRSIDGAAAEGLGERGMRTTATERFTRTEHRR